MYGLKYYKAPVSNKPPPLHNPPSPTKDKNKHILKRSLKENAPPPWGLIGISRKLGSVTTSKPVVAKPYICMLVRQESEKPLLNRLRNLWCWKTILG